MQRILILICLLSVVCLAQSKNSPVAPKPDFSGEWKQISSESRPKLDALPPRAVSPAVVHPAVVQLTISHTEPELNVTKKIIFNGKERVMNQTCFSDGRGETNSLRFLTALHHVRMPLSTLEQPMLKSRTRWEGGKLVTRYSISDTVQGRQSFISLTEKREISADGKRLTIRIQILPAIDSNEIVEVYDRVD